MAGPEISLDHDHGVQNFAAAERDQNLEAAMAIDGPDVERHILGIV